MRSAIILGSMLLLGACNVSAGAKEPELSGKKIDRAFQVAGFDRVSLGGPHNVIVTVGGAPSVRAQGDSALIEQLEIKVEDGELQIGNKDRNRLSWSSKGQPLTIYVTTGSLRAASLAGSGNLKVDRAEGKSFDAAIGGSGNIELGSLKVEQASFAIGGSGNIKAAGTAGSTESSIGGSGDLDLAGLDARRASVSIAGSGNVTGRATESADISIVGSGDVTLAGGGKCEISKVGSGEARCTG